jgi:hypothetical protein
MTLVQAEEDSIAAAADLEALRLQPAHDRERSQTAQVLDDPLARLHPAPGRASREMQRAVRGASGGAVQFSVGVSPLGKARAHERFIRVAVHGDLLEGLGAGAIAVGDGQRDGIEAGLLEDMGGIAFGRWLCRRRNPNGSARRPMLVNFTVNGGVPSVTDAVIFASGRSFSPG